MTAEEFAQALLYAQRFSANHTTHFPYPGHSITTQGESRSSGYYCLECDPAAGKARYTQREVTHLPDCPYLQFRKALRAAKELAP